jgi:hypothetical protein
MWENVNGEWIYMDKEMGADEYARQDSHPVYVDCSQQRVRDHGDRLSAGRIAAGVAGGMIVAKAAPRVGSWMLWVAGILTLIMIFM